MIRSCIVVCLAIVWGACQTEGPREHDATAGAEAPVELAEASQALLDCDPGPTFCETPPPQIGWWQGQQLPVAAAGQSYHLYTNPADKNETILALADLYLGKIVYAVKAAGPQQSQALLGATWGRGPVDIVRPPPPPPPTGTERYVMERALRYQALGHQAEKAANQCGW